jgi:NADPH:quinone reductase-like Zn-dependent oxidoreductase
MKAQIIKKFGDPSVFELTEIPKPELKPLIDKNSFNLKTAGDAHALLESGKAQGKIVISYM